MLAMAATLPGATDLAQVLRKSRPAVLHELGLCTKLNNIQCAACAPKLKRARREGNPNYDILAARLLTTLPETPA